MARSDGVDRLFGGSGDDTLDGNASADSVSLGDGNDVFTWNLLDGSDSVRGDGGRDTLDFNGTDAPERFTVTAAGPRVRLTRNLGNVTMDLDSLESARVRTFGGDDAATVGDLTGTTLDHLAFDDKNLTDAADPDTLLVDGTPGPDRITASSPQPGTLRLSGLSAVVELANADAGGRVDVRGLAGADELTTGVGVTGADIGFDGGNDVDSASYTGTPAGDGIAALSVGGPVSATAPNSARLEALGVEDVVLAGLGGTDFVRAVTNAASRAKLTLDGGDDDDLVNGGNGIETLLGGAGNDVVDGNAGADRADLGGGDDIFQSDPGDAGDSIEGGAGEDRLEVDGTAAADDVRVLRKLARAVLVLGAVSTDFAGLERVAIRSAGGADSVVVGDLTQTGVLQIDADLGADDAGADTVAIEGTPRRDRIAVTRDGKDAVLVDGLSARTRITGSEPALDTLRIDPRGGDFVTVAPDVQELIRTLVGLV